MTLLASPKRLTFRAQTASRDRAPPAGLNAHKGFGVRNPVLKLLVLICIEQRIIH